MDRITCNVTFAANNVTFITIGQSKVTFQLCLDLHWKDRLKNSNHVFCKHALQNSNFIAMYNMLW